MLLIIFIHLLIIGMYINNKHKADQLIYEIRNIILITIYLEAIASQEHNSSIV